MAASALPPNTPSPKAQNLSFWMSRNISNAEGYPSLRSMPDHHFDVVVIGAGITGLTAALHLKRYGKRVAVLEHHTVGSGTTGSSTGHLSLHLDSNYSTIQKHFNKQKSAQVFRGQTEARDDVAINCSSFNIPGYEGNLDVYLYAEPGMDAKRVRDEYVALSYAGAKGVDLLPYKKGIGLPFPTEQALVLPGNAQFDSYAYCLGLARAVHGGGSAVYERTRVVGLKDGSPCEVQTEFVTLRARDVICATHTPLGISVIQTAMVPHLSFAVAVRIEQSFPAGLYYDTHEPYHYMRRLDSANPHIVIIGGSDKKTGGSSASELDCFADLRRYIGQRFTVQQELAHWCSQYYPSPDGLPYVGTDPGKDHIWIATGFSGDGLSLGTVSGKILAMSIMGKSHPLAGLYSSHRFKPIASARHFLSEQVSVAKHMVIDRLTSAHASLDEIAPGEGRVVKVSGRQVAAYREPDGRLHAHSAVCTHLKCLVKWNDSERTFDCPCHGSRFSVCGTVLEGPALRDLEDLLEDKCESMCPPPPAAAQPHGSAWP